jgi:hypothetical protein
VEGWRSWSAMHQAYEGPWRELVHHSGRASWPTCQAGVYSKLMCWVALDRAIALADTLGATDRVEGWTATRDEIRTAMGARLERPRRRLHPVLPLRRSGRQQA